MDPDEHPGKHQLVAFAKGELTDEDDETIAGHLENCPTCAGVVESLECDGFRGLRLLKHLEMPSSTVAEFLQNRNRNDVKGTLQSNRSESVEIARATTATDKSGIQKYQVMETLAEGGMGQVVKAFQRELKIHVAIKVLPPFSDAGQDEIERFDREIETLARLTHPNIVQAKDAGDWEGRRFLAMEFLDGLDVSKVAKRTPEFPVADACELIRQAAVGLHFAHEKGVVHRDVKPSNLMLAWSPSGIEDKIAMVKILDLGLARLLMENSTLTGGLTLSGQILGT